MPIKQPPLHAAIKLLWVLFFCSFVLSCLVNWKPFCKILCPDIRNNLSYLKGLLRFSATNLINTNLSLSSHFRDIYFQSQTHKFPLIRKSNEFHNLWHKTGLLLKGYKIIFFKNHFYFILNLNDQVISKYTFQDKFLRQLPC